MTFEHAGLWGPDNLDNRFGRPLVDTVFEVRLPGTSTLADLWADRDRSTAAANPGVTGATGNLSFYADPGYYDLYCLGTTLRVLVPLDPADAAVTGTGAVSGAAGPLSQYDAPFPVTGSVPGAWQGHPVWADSGPTIRETSYDPLVPGWAAQDPNGFVIPFEGIAPISPVGLWGNGFTALLTGTLLGPVDGVDTVDPTLPILTVPQWARPGADWTLDGCAAFRVRWAYQDDTEPYAWHIVRTDENVVGQMNADGELTIPGGWPTPPPDGATSILLDLGVVAWFAWDVAPKTMPVGWAHRAKTEILDSDAHVSADAGTIFCDGLANLWTAGGGHTYQDGMQVHVLTGAASVMVSDYESDEPFLDPAGVAVHSYVLPAHTHAVLSRSNGTWRLSVLGANQTQTVPVTPADEAATTAPTWYQAGFDGAQRISGIIAGKVDLGEGVITSVVARIARVTSLDGAWSDKWYLTGAQTADGTTWGSGMALVSPVDPDEPTIFDILSASPLPAMAVTPTLPSHAANKGYVDDAVRSALSPLFAGGPNLGDRWAIVGNPDGVRSWFTTPTWGSINTGDGWDTRAKLTILEPQAGVAPGSYWFAEWCTRERQAAGAWGADQDDNEDAVYGADGRLGLFVEDCLTETPAETEHGEDAAGRLYSLPPEALDYDYYDPTFQFTYGDTITVRKTYLFDDGNGNRVKTLWREVALADAEDTTADGRSWKRVVQNTIPGVGSVADSDQPWAIALNVGATYAIAWMEGRVGIDGTLALHFDPADVQEDGTVVSSLVTHDYGAGVVPQTWTPHGVPIFTDSTLGREITAAEVGAIPTSEKGAADGVAELDGDGKLPVAQLPTSAMTYVGAWDAATNTPTLVDGVGDPGDQYRVTVAGTRDLGSGSQVFRVGDQVIANASRVWERGSATNGVDTVYGRSGAVVAADADYAASQVTVSPTGLAIVTTNRVQAAIAELDAGVNARIPKDVLTTKGDIPVATGSATVSRLGVGSVGQALSPVPSAASGLGWQSPPHFLWPVAVGAWWSVPHDSTYDQALTLNRCLYVPIWIPPEVTQVDGILIRLAVVGAAGATVRLGLHLPHATTRFPSTRAIDGGTLDTTATTGARELPITATNVTPSSLAYVSVVAQGAICSLKFANTGSWLLHTGVPSTTSLDVLGANGSIGWFETGVSGALPATATPTFSSNTVAQAVVGLRRSA